MAKENEMSVQPSEAVAQQAQQPQARPCPQDCRQCGMSQQVFCTTKMLFDLSRAQQVLGQHIASVVAAMADLRAQMQAADAALSMPSPEG